MRYRVGEFYQSPRHFGIFKCVARVDGTAFFRELNEDKMRLEEDLKSSDDGEWTEVPSENIPQKYYYIEE